MSLRSAPQLVIPLAVISINPANNAVSVPSNTNVVATFNCLLIPATVNPDTFKLTYSGGVVPGSVIAFTTTATFTPSMPLPEGFEFTVRIVGGPMGVRGQCNPGGVVMTTSGLVADFVSTFRTGSQPTEVDVSPAAGATVTDPRTGASTTIPPRTLKVNARVKLVVLDSPGQFGGVDNTCDVPLSPTDTFPRVVGFEQASAVMRIEGRPCDTDAYGPGMTLRLPLLSQFQTVPDSDTELRLYQLGRSATGGLMFLDTGIAAKVSRTQTGSFAVIPDIQVFGTFAAFLPIRKSGFGIRDSAFGIKREFTNSGPKAPNPVVLKADGDTKLFFPIIDQSNGRATRLSIANDDSAGSLSVVFIAYGADGNQEGVALREIPSSRAGSFLVSELFPGFQRGAIIALADGTMTGSIEIANNFANPTMWATAEAVTTGQSSLVLPIIEATSQTFTEVHIFNPNSEPVNIRLMAFDRNRRLVEPTGPRGEKLTSLMVPASGKVIASGLRATPSSPGITLPFASLDGGYLLVNSLDQKQGIVAAELLSETRSGRTSLTMVNGLTLPAGCRLSESTNGACHVDESPTSSVPQAANQHTLYAFGFENSPARAELVVINVGDGDAPVAFTAYGEDGRYRATWPTSTVFRNLRPNEVVSMSAQDMFTFNPAPGYVRIEDPDSSIVGVVVTSDPSSNRYKTILPLMPDKPELTQTTSQSFLSRIQVDPTSSNPRVDTGLTILNPNNNPLSLAITIRSSTGQSDSNSQTVVERGMVNRMRPSVSVLFPEAKVGFVEVLVTTNLAAGEGGRIFVVGVYRSRDSLSSFIEQTKAP
jgi:hypothetical protein